MKHISYLVALFLLLPLPLAAELHPATHEIPGTILVPAADFFDQIPAGDSNDGRFPPGEWFFNEDTINLGSAQDAVATVDVKQAGVYHLFVLSIGTATSSFQVAVNGQLDPGVYGQGALSWKPGGSFNLKPGPIQIRLTSIHPRPSLNILVLSKNAAFGQDDLKGMELPPQVKLLREYHIVNPNILKFGDIEGNGKYGIFDIANDWSAYMYDNAGHELWHWQAPPPAPGLRPSNEAPSLLWDFNGDGRDEAVYWRQSDGKEWLVMADGRTGAILHKVPWPAPPPPHVFNNYRLAVAKFHSGRPDTLLVLSDTGGTISLTAYDGELHQLWQHIEQRKKDYFGHYIYPVDINGKGIDDVFISHLCLDSKGNVVWDNDKYFNDNHDHMDNMVFFDINGDGKLEQVVGQSDVGAMAYNAHTGAILWQNIADHTQQITAGYILSGSKTPQIVANGRTYAPRPARPRRAPGGGGAGSGGARGGRPGAGRPGGAGPSGVRPGNRFANRPFQGLGGGGLGAQLYWFDNKGNLLSRWPAHPLSANPNFVHGDWYGNGKQTYFWYRFRLEPDGKATLYFKGEVYEMFDFVGNGAEQVVTLDGPTIRVYGYAGVKPKKVVRDAEYLQKVANITHY